MKIYLSSSTYKPTTNDFREHYDPEEQPSLTDPSQAMEAKDILRTYGRAGAIRVLRQQFPELEQDRDSTTRDVLASYEFADKFDKMQMAETLKNHSTQVQASIQAKKKRAEEIKARLAEQNSPTPPPPPTE